MSIIQLSSQHFQVAGQRKKTMHVAVPGNVLVFFKTQGCSGCGAMEPVFQQVARGDPRIQYCIVDISIHRDIIKMSHQSSTPIQKVPHLIFYSNSSPRAVFKGKKTIQGFKNFIDKMLNMVGNQQVQQQPRQTFMPQQQEYTPHQQSIYGGYALPDTKVYTPEDIGSGNKSFGKALSGGSGYAKFNSGMDDDNDVKLEMPHTVTPHNMPWDSDYRKMDNLD